MTDSWLMRRQCPACGLGIYVLIAYAGRMPKGQPPEACRCRWRDSHGRERKDTWRRRRLERWRMSRWGCTIRSRDTESCR